MPPMSFESDLITWYRANRRHMSWREDPLPYHVYLSEIMLQQTQVDTVRAYYERFLTAFPTLKDLAKGSEEEVLKLWEGLGYYSRGRNLHKSAEEIVERFKGEIPMGKEDLLSLPGIGEYTARAIRSIAFHQKEIAVDGNLIRVYSRLEESSEDNLEKSKALCEAYFLSKLQQEDPSSFNQALMDLGEMICLPKALPLCEKCPLKQYCGAAKDGTMLSYPAPKKSKEKRQEDWTIFVLSYQDKVAVEKRKSEGLLASLYQFPMTEGKLTLEQSENLLQKEGYVYQSLHDLGTTQHVFSHLIWNLQGYWVNLSKLPENKELLWSDKEGLKKRYAIPSAFAFYKKKILAK
jgi:A/G-specific adenine glycosylase